MPLYLPPAGVRLKQGILPSNSITSMHLHQLGTIHSQVEGVPSPATAKEGTKDERQFCHNRKSKGLRYVMPTSFAVSNVSLKTDKDQFTILLGPIISYLEYSF